ncbi:hypothetical protein GB931_22210 [Modestobacter sp. I12A-02628]|uniref:Metalloprotease n=1 Tax=Goekera deserti TaxID=2497753 RepID=A0A7K3WGR0_9ACTN|nr:hypothetical protein [Goekera deserti]MPR00588.1 hypothetical protein [Goekera deserti]NDI50124.1 hypothetical protein [Goekera deserti]NEL55691.1 hypothetical protein [Goekera deserti]
MRHVLRRGLAAGAACGLLLTGCATAVTGQGRPGAGIAQDVSPDQQRIDGSVVGDPVDDTARDALADLDTYWQQTFPETFGGSWEPLAGTLNSVDPDDFDPADYPDGLTCGLEVADVEDNAYYCAAPDYPNSDGITYDRSFMAELAGEYGRYLPSLVMAHEWGHAIQARYDDAPQASINAETQADCFAGSFTRWVLDGEAQYTSLRAPELDQALQGFLLIRDPVGTDADEQGAHGSFFDRVSGFQEGYDGGAGACRDAFGDGERVFTQQPFTDDEDLDNNGNLPLEDGDDDPRTADTLEFTVSTLETFWTTAFDQLFDAGFQPPAVELFPGSGPDCEDLDADRDLGYCPDDQTVYVDETDLIAPAYEIGDFAVATAVALPYAEAARAQLDLPDDDEQAVTTSTICLAGWYAAQLFNETQETAQLSPGDLDEAISFLLDFGTQAAVFPGSELSGFELVDTYRSGFFEGAGVCDVGV